MLLKDEVDLLRKVPLFAHLDPAKLKLLAFTSTRASFKPGQELFHQRGRCRLPHPVRRA